MVKLFFPHNQDLKESCPRWVSRSEGWQEGGKLGSHPSAPCYPSPEGCWAFWGPQVNVLQNLQETSVSVSLAWLLV